MRSLVVLILLFAAGSARAAEDCGKHSVYALVKAHAETLTGPCATDEDCVRANVDVKGCNYGCGMPIVRTAEADFKAWLATDPKVKATCAAFVGAGCKAPKPKCATKGVRCKAKRCVVA